jgi:galactitol-specific phosphotransferase system IIC component
VGERLHVALHLRDSLRAWLAPIARGVAVAGPVCLVTAIIDIVDVLSRTTTVLEVTIRMRVEWGLWMVAISSAALFATAWVVAVQVGKAIRTAPSPRQ